VLFDLVNALVYPRAPLDLTHAHLPPREFGLAAFARCTNAELGVEAIRPGSRTMLEEPRAQPAGA